MAEQTNDTVTEKVDTSDQQVDSTAKQVATKPPDYTDVERRAMSQGWVPEDQYEGTKKWRDAEEFLERGEFFTRIEEQGRRLKAAEMTTNELKKHLEIVRKTEYNRALAALKAKKAEALDNGDNAAVVELDEEIADTKFEFKKLEAEPVVKIPDQVIPNPAFVAWTNRNSWYNSDKAMRIYANTIGDEMVAAGETNPTEVLVEVERRVKKEFAHKFTNPNRGKAGAVDGAGSKGSQSNDSFQLTDDERRVMQKFVRAKVMTEKEYIAEIKASRGD